MIAGYEFPIDQVWTAIQALLAEQLGKTVDVDCIGEQDFDEDGVVTIQLPAARVLFAGEIAGPPTETQNEVYNPQQAYGVICGDEDLGPNPQDQRIKSVQLAGQVKHILTGARLQLDGAETEPVIYVKTEAVPTSASGMAYLCLFSIGGIAQFDAPNAYPSLTLQEVQ